MRVKIPRAKILIIGKNAGATSMVNAGFNAKFVSGVSMDQNSGKKENNCSSVGEKMQGDFSVGKPFFKLRAKRVRRVRRFYYETDSDEEGVRKRRRKMRGHTASEKVKKQCSSSQPQLPSPDRVFPRSPTSSADLRLPIMRVKIPRPKILIIGKNGERQIYDPNVLNNNTEGKYLGNTEVLPQGISSSSLQTELVQKTTSISCERTYRNMQHQILKEKCHSKPHTIHHEVLQGKCSNAQDTFDLIPLLLGHLKRVDLVCVGNQTFAYPKDGSGVLKAQRNDSRSKRDTRSETDSKEPEVEIVFENVSSPSKKPSVVFAQSEDLC